MGPAIAAAMATAAISAAGTVLAAWVQGRPRFRRLHSRDQGNARRRSARQQGRGWTRASSR